jgi:hypothetical protein
MTEPDYWPPDLASSPLPNAIPFRLTDPVNLGQLNQELSAALNTEVQGVLVGPYEDGGSILWLTPPSADPDIVAQVVEDHVPDPDWGLPSVVAGYEEAMSKLGDDPNTELSAEEVRILAAGNALRLQGM